MKPYSVDLREKVVKAYHAGNISVRNLAMNFGVGKGFVQKMLRQYKEEGHVNPGKQGTNKKGKCSRGTYGVFAIARHYH